MSKTFQFGNGEWAVGKETALAYNDENSNFKPLPFTFDRASTATVVNKQGLIETVGIDEPRIDFLNNTKGHLLLEPERRNLVTYSEDLTATGWGSGQGGTGISPTRTANYGISPDGSQTASRVQFDLNGGTSSSDISFISFYYTATGTATTNSIYMKSLSGTADVRMRCGSTFKEVDVTTEWKRFDVTDGSTSDRVQVLLYGNLNSQSADLLIWGVQAEQGSYATSYIPTQGSAVTRSAEGCSQTTPDGVIGQTEGTIFAEFRRLDSITNLILWMRDPSGGNYGDMIKLECGADNIVRYEVRASNVTSCNLLSDVLPSNIYYKIAVAYKQNDFVMYLNGVQIAVDTLGNVPTCSEMYVGRYIDGGIRMGDVKSLDLYNTRLSNSELQALTT